MVGRLDCPAIIVHWRAPEARLPCCPGWSVQKSSVAASLEAAPATFSGQSVRVISQKPHPAALGARLAGSAALSRRIRPGEIPDEPFVDRSGRAGMSCDSAGLPSQSLVGTRLLVMSWAMGLTSAMGGPCSCCFRGASGLGKDQVPLFIRFVPWIFGRCNRQRCRGPSLGVAYAAGHAVFLGTVLTAALVRDGR